MIKKLGLLSVVLSCMTALHAQVDTTLDIYLLIGQSNMAGRGEITTEYKEAGSPNVLMLDKENHWVPAKHPLHFDKPKIVGVGPGLSFGIEMAKGNKHRIGLVPCAVGGTSINVWNPGGYDKSTNTHPWDDMVKRLDTAMKAGTIKGVIWLQGEADSDSTKSIGYISKLEELINRLRTLTKNPSLPFVAGELGQYKDQYRNINEKLAGLPAKVSFTAIASSKGFTDVGDQTHFDSRSADEFGKRFAEQMKNLQKSLNKKKNK